MFYRYLSFNRKNNRALANFSYLNAAKKQPEHGIYTKYMAVIPVESQLYIMEICHLPAALR